MKLDKVIVESVPNQARSNELIGRLFDVAKPGVIFSEPIAHGEHVIITASEVTIAMGAGYGGGAGYPVEDGENGGAATAAENGNVGIGGGGGGGGTAMGRPVAIVSIGPEGVHVEPVVDPTKIALAFFTAFGSLVFGLGRMFRAARKR